MGGGPGRIRTSNQTVMSGGTRSVGVDFPHDLASVIVFVASRCDRFWCETGAVIATVCRKRLEMNFAGWFGDAPWRRTGWLSMTIVGAACRTKQVAETLGFIFALRPVEAADATKSLENERSVFIEIRGNPWESSPTRRFGAPCAQLFDPPWGVGRIMYSPVDARSTGMSWTAHYFDPRLNRVAVSRVFASKEDALRQACDLMLRKCVVRFVTGPNEERLDAVAITKWCKGHRTALKPQLPK